MTKWSPTAILAWQRSVCQCNLSKAAKHVLLALSTYADKGGQAWPSKRALATATGMSRSTVFRGLREAEASGWLHRTSTDQGERTVYRLSPSGHPKTEDPSHGDTGRGLIVTPPQSDDDTPTRPMMTRGWSDGDTGVVSKGAPVSLQERTQERAQERVGTSEVGREFLPQKPAGDWPNPWRDKPIDPRERMDATVFENLWFTTTGTTPPPAVQAYLLAWFPRKDVKHVVAGLKKARNPVVIARLRLTDIVKVEAAKAQREAERRKRALAETARATAGPKTPEEQEAHNIRLFRSAIENGLEYVVPDKYRWLIAEHQASEAVA